MESSLTKYVGLELADIRKNKGLKIVDVANKTSINKDTISKYENGKSSIKIYILGILLNFYEINIDIFFKNVYDRMQKYI
jgi:transcriptional regulator with XRE-family HTH domain